MPRFADIQGQERAHALLRRAAERGRLPHAYLFHGTRGVGKTTTAFALAQFLNCEAPTAEDSCGECPSCRKFMHLRHPDLHWIFPMAGSEGGKRLKGDARAEHVRAILDERLSPGIHGLTYPGSAVIAIGRDEDSVVGSVGELRRQAGYAPVEARVKVFVVSEADRMTTEAANSLLKILEEPPPDNLLVLTTDRPSGLLDTIVSRCQAVRFRDLAEDAVAALLVERAEAAAEAAASAKGRKKPAVRVPTPEAAALAAALARGSLTYAQNLLDSGDDVVEQRDQALAFLRLPAGDPRLHEEVKELSRAETGAKGRPTVDRRAAGRLIEFGLLWQADLLRAATGSDVSPANRDRAAEIRAEAADLDVPTLRRRIQALEEARRAMEGNVFMPLVLYRLAHVMSGAAAALDR